MITYDYQKRLTRLSSLMNIACIIILIIVSGVYGNSLRIPPSCFPDSTCIVELQWSDFGSAFNISIKVSTSYFSLIDTDHIWVGLGISETGEMDNSQITLCTLNNNRVKITQVRGYSHGVSPVTIGPSLTSQTAVTRNNDFIACRFILHRSLIDSDSKFLLVGSGPVEDSSVLYHHSTPLVSETRISLSDSASGSDSAVKKITNFRILLHASAMITGYGIFLVLGILTSRYLKPLFDTAWYRIHTQIVFLMVFLVAIGLAAIFLHMGTVGTGGHEVIGFIIITLTILQIILGACRPHRKHSGRLPTTFIHVIIACILFVLVIINIFLGLAKIHLGIPSHIFVIQGIYVIWIVFGAIIGNEVLLYFYGADPRVYIKKLKLYTMINIGVILMYGCTIIILLNVVE